MKHKDAKVFLAVYSNVCKSYCDETFFARLAELSPAPERLYVVDNTQGEDYALRLEKIVPSGTTLHHLEVERGEYQFQRNVTESLTWLRDRFLESDCTHFLIIESDVLVPVDCLASFEEVRRQADIVGGIYYRGFHDGAWFSPSHEELVPQIHVLSGCTMYSRKVIEACPFRWSLDNVGAFPDAWISIDAGAKGFRLANYTKIVCEHMTDELGSRGQHLIG